MSLALSLVATTLVGMAGPAIAQKAARQQVKPTAPVSVTVDMPALPVPGGAAVATIAVTAATDLTGVRVVLDPDEAIAVQAADTSWAVGDLPRGETARRTIELIPLASGRHVLDVFVTAETAMFGTVARSLAVPVTVGPSPSAVAAPERRATQGLKRLPVTETVR